MIRDAERFNSDFSLAARQGFIVSMSLACGAAAGIYAVCFTWLATESMVPQDMGRAVFLMPAIFSCIFLTASLFARRGRLLIGALLATTALVGFILVPPFYRTIGIYSVNLNMLSILIVFSGFLAGPTAARRASLFAVLVVAVVYLATRTAFIDVPLVRVVGQYFPPEQFLVVHVAIALITGWITTWYARAVHDSQLELQQRARELERSVAELEAARLGQDALNQQLVERTRDAEAGSRAKSRFLALVSHELRTPLNGVIGVAQLLKKPDLDDKVRSELLDTIISSGRALHAVTTDMLDMSKAESGRMDLLARTFDCRELLQQTVRLFAPAARARQLWLGAVCLDEGALRYTGDDLRLSQMIANLVGNAIKYTQAGGVNLTARELQRENDTVVVEFAVTDTGIGIAPESLHLLFEPFSQVEDVLTRRQGGSGLGLAIVRQLAELMQGGVGVESVPGQGSRFWFTVRLAIAPADALDFHGRPQLTGNHARGDHDGTVPGRHPG